MVHTDSSASVRSPFSVSGASVSGYVARTMASAMWAKAHDVARTMASAVWAKAHNVARTKAAVWAMAERGMRCFKYNWYSSLALYL